jgi:hypothetical protein
MRVLARAAPFWGLDLLIKIISISKMSTAKWEVTNHSARFLLDSCRSLDDNLLPRNLEFDVEYLCHLTSFEIVRPLVLKAISQGTHKCELCVLLL